jgi:stage V sporulation protein G
MPSRKLTAHCFQCGCKNHLRAAFCNQCGARLREQQAAKDEEGRVKLYADIAHPINSLCREMIQQRVIEAFQAEKARAQLPGYVPSYDDFDSEEPAVRPRPVGSPHFQAAEKPRGPHKTPAQQPHAGGPHSDGFGAGIFDS